MSCQHLLDTDTQLMITEGRLDECMYRVAARLECNVLPNYIDIPKFVFVYFKKSELLLMMLFWNLAQRIQKWKDALGFIHTNPIYVKMFVTGMCLKKEYTCAIEELNRCITSNPDNHDIKDWAANYVLRALAKKTAYTHVHTLGYIITRNCSDDDIHQVYICTCTLLIIGEVLSNENRDEEAIKLFKQVVQQGNETQIKYAQMQLSFIDLLTNNTTIPTPF